jgi:ubiquinone/menaquinone biosynthesis C-methylase UbiE
MARLLRPRPLLCSALDPAAQVQLSQLNESLARFYNGPAREHYFATADALNAPDVHHFRPQAHLLSRIPAGSLVVDLGCGSAHFCRQLDGRVGHYVGVDWSAAQMADNRRHWPRFEFIPSSVYDVPLPPASADVVISLYVVEHCVWPHKLLLEMMRIARPGGLIAILTPPFRARSYLKSFDHGLSPRPLADKLRSGKLLDACWHAYHRAYYALWLRRQYPRGTPQHRFLINLRPVVLRSETWFPDADAVYLSDTAEVRDYLQETGAEPLAHWESLGYLVMRKSEAAGSAAAA